MARKYISDFREYTVRYVEKYPELNNHQKSEYPGVPYHTLYGWWKERHRKLRAGEVAPSKGNLTPKEQEIAQLRRTNQKLQDTLKILKQATRILGD